MPLYKYVSNRILTTFENRIIGAKLSEYHTGFRGFRRNVIEFLPLLENSDDFVFDNEMLVQALSFGFRVGEISCPSAYFDEASSINFWRSLRYGFGVVSTALKYKLHRMGLAQFPFLSPEGRALNSPAIELVESKLAVDRAVEHVR
jgi:hypothetical protein